MSEPQGFPERSIGVTATIEPESGQWVVFLDISFWNENSADTPIKTIRKRITTYPTRARAEVAAEFHGASSGKRFATSTSGALIKTMMNSQNLSRPQPVGILPIPAGLLVLPGPIDAERMQQCIEAQPGADLPELWSFYQSARREDWPSTLEQLSSADTPVARYNRFVLSPAPESLATLRVTLSGDLRRLLDIAAYTFGLADEVPSTDGLDGELLALALMTRAAAEMERESSHTAITLLEQAVGASRTASPLFAA